MIKKILISIIFLVILGITFFRLLQTPSNERERFEKDATISTSTVQGTVLTVNDIRNYTRRTDDDYDVNYYDKTFDINDVERLDYFVSTFAFKEKVGHTFLSFGLKDGSQIAVSVEARKEVGEKYSPLKGLFNQYELLYVIADEQDLIPLRTEVWDDPVYRYEINAKPKEIQDLLLSILIKTNDLSEKPEFYNTIMDNCTSVLRKHANKVSPGKLGLNSGLILTGDSDFYLYDQGLIKTKSSQEELRRDHKINKIIGDIVGEEGFSELLRE